MIDVAQKIKDAPTDVLCGAAKTLQEAHDWVEVHDFSMGYGHEKGSGSACFIGSVRQAAEEYTVGSSGPSTYLASELALWALDKAARVRGYEGPTVLRTTAGGIAESTIVRTNSGRSRVLEKPAALETYRQAIREVQTELMEREDLQKSSKPSIRERIAALA